MANRRSGGMGGGPRGNRSFSQHQPFQGSGVSPWQGPSNSMNQGGLISDSQQLALALTSLLQPQQQMNNPPSLLSLNTSPAFSNQGRDFNRFGNRGREMRRHEPYNKNRNPGWRRNQNKRRSPTRDQKNKRGDGKKKDDKKETKEKKEGLADSDDEENKGDGKENGQKKGKEGPYSGVPVKFLNCFVCSKEMWDGESMNKHINGRAHRQVLESLEDSIHSTVNILREHMRLAEEKKVIEWNRMQRVTKKFSNYNDTESHCNMCDLKFMGKIIAHRKTEGHQRLKRYLHPSCGICDKEFPSRMDWVEHRLTPEHLRNLNHSLKNKIGGADGDKIILDEEVDVEAPVEEEGAEQTEQVESENAIFEMTDDLTDFENVKPVYIPDRAIATQSLFQFEGFRCELCDRSFENEEVAQNHLKTKRHYYSFVDAAKAKYKEELSKKEKDDDEKKKGDESQTEKNGDAEMYDPEEACNENEDASKEETPMEVNDEGDPSVINLGGDDAEVQEVEEDDDVVEVVPEVKKEEVKVKKDEAAKPVPASPARQTRTAAATTAGPKSKKLAATPAKAPEPQQKPKAAAASTFRIPKINATEKGKK